MNRWVVTLVAVFGFAGWLAAATIDWEPDVYPKGNLFPSLVIGTACLSPTAKIFPTWNGDHQGDVNGIVGASIGGLHKGDKFKLVVEANDLMNESAFEGTVKRNSDDDLVVHPKISYHYDRLAANTQVRPFDITMELFVNGVSEGKQSITVMLRSVNDCLFGVDEDADDNSDYSWLFAAYVNENHPWVDRILKEALDSKIVSSFDGYQANDDDDVRDQIFAIWNVMQRHGMKYSDVTTTAAESDGIHSQTVRLFDQAVQNEQANCVDGSVLLAAVLRKIGLHPSLVLVPGHMFIAVDLNDDKQIGIETTLMGEKDFTAEAGGDEPTKGTSIIHGKNSGFVSFTGGKSSAEPSRESEERESFDEAVKIGTKRLKKDAKKFESDDLDYQIIDLAEARGMGILPIYSNGPNDHDPFSQPTQTPTPNQP